jgi:hypothetical protein
MFSVCFLISYFVSSFEKVYIDFVDGEPFSPSGQLYVKIYFQIFAYVLTYLLIGGIISFVLLALFWHLQIDNIIISISSFLGIASGAASGIVHKLNIILKEKIND